MITRIELKNFMSHEHTVIELAAGLTVLVGPNNVGKSAVVAALQILSTNENSTAVMRHGAKECSVKVVTDEGHEIVWQRKTSPSYIINGAKRDRLQRGGLPDELRPALRLGLVESGDKTFDVHFGSQKDPIFLLNGTGGDAAKFFASSSDAHQLVKMQQAHKEKLTANKKEKARLEEESLKLQKQLGALEPVVLVKERAEQMEKEYAHLLELQQNIAHLQHMIEGIDQQQHSCEKMRQEHGALANLKIPPVMHNLNQLQDSMSGLEHEIARERFLTMQSSTLQKLSDVPPLHNVDAFIIALSERAYWEQKKLRLTCEMAVYEKLPIESLTLLPENPLEQLIEHLDFALQQNNYISQEVAALMPLQVVPLLDNAHELMQFVSEYGSIQNTLKKHEQIYTCVNLLEPFACDVSALEELQAFLEKYHELQNLCFKLETEYQLAKIESDKYAVELRSQLSGMQCPTCNREINADEFLATAVLGITGHVHE